MHMLHVTHLLHILYWIKIWTHAYHVTDPEPLMLSLEPMGCSNGKYHLV